jgi:twitching motility protein PilT
MRDVETMQTVLTLAETGHLRVATLHTSSGAKTIHRIVDAFPDRAQPQIRAQLALALEAVLSQALLPRVGGGLALATELMLGTAGVRAMIRDGRVHQIYSAIQAGQEFGMITLNHALARLVRGGLVTIEDAVAHASDIEELRQLLAM